MRVSNRNDAADRRLRPPRVGGERTASLGSSAVSLPAACPCELPTRQYARASLHGHRSVAPRLAQARDIAALIGVLAVREGELSGTQDADEIPVWAAHLAQRLSRDGLLPSNADWRELRQALSNLNQRLRYVLGEYDEPPDAMPLP